MRCKRANIDSLNLSSENLESVFIRSEDYIIETVKSKSVFKPEVWKKIFGNTLTKNIKEAKIIHTYRGLCLPLKTFASTPQRQTIEFAGLWGYNDRSEQIRETLEELESQLSYNRITRIDVAIDFKGGIPNSIIKMLSRHREPFQWKNSVYWKTPKEKRTNSLMDIKVYDKAIKENLDYPLMRLEFCFKSGYFKSLLFRDIETVFVKMKKSIKRATGLTVCIKSING